MLPTLLPAMWETFMSYFWNTFKTPRCANPRANPPPRASPTPGRRDGLAVPGDNFSCAELRCSFIHTRMPAAVVLGYGPAVLKKQYECTCPETPFSLCAHVETVRTY